MSLNIRKGAETAVVELRPGWTLLDAVRSLQGVELPAPCGGAGTCGKCTVELGDGRRVLACQTAAEDGMTILLPEGDWGEQVLLEGRETHAVAPDPGLTGYGVACDIGTTTVVCHLIGLETGARLDTLGEGNRQQSFGADVISRIQAASEGHLAELTAAITGQLSQMIRQLCTRTEVDLHEVRGMAVAANTTMCHLLCGLDPEGIGRAPFRPASYFGETYPGAALGLPVDGPVYIAPAVSGYVGGDVTADVAAVGLEYRDRPALLIDVGTNGEMVLGCRDRILCCSTAAGPAFEGAQIRHGMTAQAGAIQAVEYRDGQVVCSVLGGGPAKGICGSGLIDAVAVMLEVGALDETGRLLDPEEDEDIPEAALPWLFETGDGEMAFRLTGGISVTQADVRKVQLGKGAIAAGERVLLDAYGVGADQLGGLFLAGGFGSYMRPESAARIGLIPRSLLPVTRAVGNTAAEGACMALLSGRARERLNSLRDRMEYIELSGMQEFNTAYMEAMMFPGAEEA